MACQMDTTRGIGPESGTANTHPLKVLGTSYAREKGLTLHDSVVILRN